MHPASLSYSSCVPTCRVILPERRHSYAYVIDDLLVRAQLRWQRNILNEILRELRHNAHRMPLLTFIAIVRNPQTPAVPGGASLGTRTLICHPGSVPRSIVPNSLGNDLAIPRPPPPPGNSISRPETFLNPSARFSPAPQLQTPPILRRIQRHNRRRHQPRPPDQPIIFLHAAANGCPAQR